MKIMFMGTPEIAIPSLNELSKNHEICCIVTQADKPRGRGHKLTSSPVAAWGEEHAIDVLKPISLKDNQFMPELEKYSPDIICVVAYGKILPNYILEYPIFGSYNLHFSLLPKYRGAAPVQRAIINGEEETGVCIIEMAEKLDAGDIIYQEKYPIEKTDTAESLFKILSFAGGKALAYAIDNLKSLEKTKQNDAESTYAEMLTKENSFIDFSKSPEEIVNFIRGYNPSPIARMEHEGEILKVLSAEIKNGELNLLEVQPPNKGKMLFKDYLNGKR